MTAVMEPAAAVVRLGITVMSHFGVWCSSRYEAAPATMAATAVASAAAAAAAAAAGGAFALVVADTQVASAGLVLFGGQGGPGGDGGSGSGGTSGVHDDTWGSSGESTGTPCGPKGGGPIIAGAGGQGGYGGNGGGGGGGAGGNGGPSIQLVNLADGVLTMDANATFRYAGGRSGTGGTGGTGGQDNNAGPPGNSGSSADQMSIPLVVHVSATASSNTQDAALAVDGNPNTAWNSGGDPQPGSNST